MWNFSVSRQRPAKICVEFVVLKIPKEFIVEFWIHQVCVSCAGRSGCRICEVLYTRTSTFFCLKELFAFLVLRHFGIAGCHWTARFSFAWLRSIKHAHRIVGSEESCRYIFGHVFSEQEEDIATSSRFSAYILDRYGIDVFDRLILMLSLLLPSLLIFRIGGVVSPVHSQSNGVVLIILWCMCARAFGSNAVLGHSIMLTSVFSFFLTYCGREEDGWIIRVVHCNMCWWWSVDVAPFGVLL